MKQVIFISGASGGSGALATHALAEAGHTVYAGLCDTPGRNAPLVDAARFHTAANDVDLRTIELDGTSQASVDATIRQIVMENGRIDVVIHNADHMVFGPAETFMPERLARGYDGNVLTTLRVNRAVLPQFRKQRRGLIVCVSTSSAGGRPPSFVAPYFAVKAAMDALADSYATELARWGIETSIVMPGDCTSSRSPFASAGRPGRAVRSLNYDSERYSRLGADLLEGFASIVPGNAGAIDVAAAIVKVVGMPYGKRSLRIHVDPPNDDTRTDDGNVAGTGTERLRNIQLTDLLTPVEL